MANTKGRIKSSSNPIEILKASKNLFKAINSKNPKRLSEWGFEVDDTPKSTSKPLA